MDIRNKIGLYGSYFLAMASVGFILPYLPPYLAERGFDDRQIGLLWTVAALSSLAQFPIGIWSDRAGWRKPLLVAALAVLAVAALLLPAANSTFFLALVAVLFAENGLARASVESLTGAEAVALAPPGQVGAALGALRFWKPVGIVAVALVGGWFADRQGVGTLLLPLAGIQGAAVLLALLIHRPTPAADQPSAATAAAPAGDWRQALTGDRSLRLFILAMVLFHVANSPGGVYLSLFLRRTLGAPQSALAQSFAVGMGCWMLVVWPLGRLADRFGRRPLLILCWALMTLRLLLLALATNSWQVLAIQALDGAASAGFAVLAASWVTDRLGARGRGGEAQVIVGCSLVVGSAIGPAFSGFLVELVGYRALFGLLAAIGALATALVVLYIPETVSDTRAGGRAGGP